MRKEPICPLKCLSTDSNENEEIVTIDDASVNECLQEKTGDATMDPERRNPRGNFHWLCNGKVIILILVLAFLNGFMIGFFVRLGIRKPKDNQSPATQWHIVSCPKGWVGYEGRCYYFSETDGTWDFGQRKCSSYGASLISINTQQEMDFVMHYKTSTECWFGLRKQEEGQPWKWTDGSIFSNWFKIRGDGFCAYLNDEGVSSARCDTIRHWICIRSLQSFCREKLLDLPISSPDDNCTVVTYEVPKRQQEKGGR